MGKTKKRSAAADVCIGGVDMPRPKKDARYMNLYIASSIADQIDAFAAQTGLPKSRIAETAFEEYLKKHIKERNGTTEYVAAVALPKEK